MSNGQPWWYAQCAANIKLLQAPYNVMCDANHCDSAMVVGYSEMYCACQPPYPNSCSQPPPPGCCGWSATTPVPVMSLGCYCCCGCFANSTPVAFDKDHYKPIIEFEVNVDMVYVADDVSLKSWSQRRVLFSAGAGDAGAANMMLKVSYGEGADKDYLLVNRGQIFLLPDRTLKPASALVPGVDSVVKADGTPLPVIALEAGIFKKGMHHVATSVGAATSPNGHLLLAKGIVCGDWALQVALSSEQLRAGLPLAKDLDHAPEFGTREYAAAYATLEHKAFRAIVPGKQAATASATEFESLDEGGAAYIPENAFAFLTSDQSWDIFNHAPISPPLSQAGKENVRYLFKLFSAFYPNIEFYYDERSLMPNAYYFEEYGTSRVIVTGGLARCQDMRFEGLALAIANIVGATTGGPPLNDSGVSCMGVAAYSAIGGVMTEVWFGLGALSIIKAGIPQLENLFAWIQPNNRGGSDTCMHISTDCRIAAMQASLNMMPLPHCAGGPPDPALEVVGATATAGLPHSIVTVTFNMPVDQVTGLAPANYAFNPLAEATSVSLAPGNPSAVAIKVNLALKTSYTVTAVGVLSQSQQPLVPGQDSASFTTK
jgi:hypothetical protein